MNKLTTIKSAINASELAVAKSYLEDNNIMCYLRDEYLGQITSTGVSLQVTDTDAEKAIELLISGGFATKEDIE